MNIENYENIFLKKGNGNWYVWFDTWNVQEDSFDGFSIQIHFDSIYYYSKLEVPMYS